MSSRKRLQDLTRITALRFQVDQAKMARLVTREAELRRKLHELIAQRKARAEEVSGRDDAARIAGADLQWHLWIDQRRSAINAELAQVLAMKADCQAVLKKSFGQDQAAQALSAQAQRRERTVAKRRQSYES